MLRLLADENFNGRILRALKRQIPDLDVVRAQDTRMLGADDPALLEFAADEKRVLLTHDQETPGGACLAARPLPRPCASVSFRSPASGRHWRLRAASWCVVSGVLRLLQLPVLLTPARGAIAAVMLLAVTAGVRDAGRAGAATAGAAAIEAQRIIVGSAGRELNLAVAWLELEPGWQHHRRPPGIVNKCTRTRSNPR